MASYYDKAFYLNSGGIPFDNWGTVAGGSGATVNETTNYIPAGACVVCVVCEATATTAGSVSDGGTNTYTLAASQTLTGGGILMVFIAYNCTAMGTCTLTYTKNNTANNASIASFFSMMPITSGSPVDSAVTASAAGSTTTPSVTSGTPGQANELIIAVCGYNSTGTATTQAPGFMGGPPDTVTGKTNCQILGGYVMQNAAATETYAPTLPATMTGNAVIILGLKCQSFGAGWIQVPRWTPSASVSAGALCRQQKQPTAGNERVFICTVAGTAGSTEPTWVVTRGAKTTDNTVTWMEVTGQAALNGDNTNTVTWASVKSGTPNLGVIIQNVAGTYLFICTTSGAAGTGSEPTWNTTTGATTTDNAATWTCIGSTSAFAKWSAPHWKIANAIASNWLGANMNLYVGDNHVENLTANAAMAFPAGTSSAGPNNVVSSDHTSSCPPTSKAGARFYCSNSGNTLINNSSCWAYIYGFYIVAGNNSLSITGNQNQRLTFDTCTFDTGTYDQTLSFGSNSGQSETTYLNCNIGMQYNSFGSGFSFGWGYHRWRGGQFVGALATYGSGAWNGGGSGSHAVIVFEGMDMSRLTNATIFSGGGGTSACVEYIVKDCKLNASAGVAANNAGLQIDILNTDSGATNYRNERYRFEGSQTTNIVVVRTNGAAVEGTSISRQITTTANCTWGNPFHHFPITIRNTVTAANRNVTVYGIANMAAMPTNAQWWFDVEYMGSASTPLGSYAQGGTGLFSTAGTALTADTSAWDSAATARANSHSYSTGNIIKLASNPGRLFFCTAGGTSASSEPAGYASAVDGGTVTDGGATFRAGWRFSLTVTLSSPQPQKAGLLTLYPKTGVASSTLYYDPLPVLS
jgi:hypothetical protein